MNKRAIKLSNLPYFWLVLPGTIFLIIVFIFPLSTMVKMSLNEKSSIGEISNDYSLTNYKKVLSDVYYLKIFFNTFLIGFVVTFLTILFSFPLAYKYVHSEGRMKEIYLFIILGPLLITMVVRVYGWMVILGSNGLINNALLFLGIIENPIKLMYNVTGVIIGLTHVLLPFMAISIATSMQNIDENLYEAAEILGSSGLNSFFKITLPLCKPGIIAGSMLVFSLAVSVFVTPIMLGGSGLRSLVVLIYTHGLVLINWPLAATLATLLIAVLVFIMYLQNRLQENN
jgi:putative spermidine/putrescine transport system permease protein